MYLTIVFLLAFSTLTTDLYLAASPVLDISIRRLFAPVNLDRQVPSQTIDRYEASLRSSKGSSSVNIYGDLGGRRPYNVYGASSGGTKVDFFGAIRSMYPPYLLPLRIISAEAEGKASGFAWYGSQTV